MTKALINLQHNFFLDFHCSIPKQYQEKKFNNLTHVMIYFIFFKVFQDIYAMFLVMVHLILKASLSLCLASSIPFLLISYLKQMLSN